MKKLILFFLFSASLQAQDFPMRANIVPGTTNTYDLGKVNAYWDSIFARHILVTTINGFIPRMGMSLSDTSSLAGTDSSVFASKDFTHNQYVAKEDIGTAAYMDSARVMTLDKTQTVTGIKTFRAVIGFGSTTGINGIKSQGAFNIVDTVGGGYARLMSGNSSTPTFRFFGNTFTGAEDTIVTRNQVQSLSYARLYGSSSYEANPIDSAYLGQHDHLQSELISLTDTLSKYVRKTDSTSGTTGRYATTAWVLSQGYGSTSYADSLPPIIIDRDAVGGLGTGLLVVGSDVPIIAVRDKGTGDVVGIRPDYIYRNSDAFAFPAGGTLDTLATLAYARAQGGGTGTVDSALYVTLTRMRDSLQHVREWVVDQGYSTGAGGSVGNADSLGGHPASFYVAEEDSVLMPGYVTPTRLGDTSAVLRELITSSVTASVGQGVTYFYDDSASTIGGYNLLSRFPITRTQEVDSGQVDSDNAALDTVLIETYASPVVGLNTLQIDAGEWTFNFYAGTSTNTGTNMIRVQVYSRTGSTETLLFSLNTIDLSGNALNLYTTRTVQPAFVVTDTSRLIVKVYALTIGSTTPHYIYFSHNGTSNYSNIVTPILLKHNELRGLDGGTTDAYFHLTKAAGSTAYTDSVVLKAQLLKNADSTTVTNTITAGVATGHVAYASAAGIFQSAPHNRGLSTDSLAVKSDFPRVNIGWTLDSSYVNLTDTLCIPLPDYLVTIDSIDVFLQGGAACNVDIKFMHATNPRGSWTNAVDTVTVTSVTAGTWISGANILTTLPANGLISAIFTETTTKPKQIIIHIVGKRQANGVNY
jgi:hypothetical protein